MPWELRVALRYLTARRKQAFISLISAVAVLGVAVGVAALFIALGLMTGLQSEIRARILGATAHVSIFRARAQPLVPALAEADLRRLRDLLHDAGDRSRPDRLLRDRFALVQLVRHSASRDLEPLTTSRARRTARVRPARRTQERSRDSRRIRGRRGGPRRVLRGGVRR